MGRKVKRGNTLEFFEAVEMSKNSECWHYYFYTKDGQR